jgi:hypothetical protein
MHSSLENNPQSGRTAFVKGIGLSALLVVCFAVLLAPWGSASASEPDVAVIGDSITWQTTTHLEDLLPRSSVDGVIGRTFSQAEPILVALLEKRTPDVLVVSLGTNPTLTDGLVESFMAHTKDIRRVVFVNIRIPRTWEAPTNTLINDLPNRYSSVSVVDWYGYSGTHPYVFNDSGFHLSEAGKPEFAALVAAGAYRALGLCHPADPGYPQPCDWEGTFMDDDRSIFQDDIEWLAASGITRGCNPPENNRFCPDSVLTRGQLAAMLVRAFGWTDGAGEDRFVDDDDSIFEREIDILAARGVTKGCNPPDSDRFCVDDHVTRGQLAAMLVRAFDWTDGVGDDRFADDDASIFENDIDVLAAADVTRGCNPPANDRFCPEGLVTRGQLAAMLHRAFSP